MSAWAPVTAQDVRPGDVVRLPNGHELLVTRVDANHLGRPEYLKLVEDTDERWICFVMPTDRELEVRREA
jgi:hypothetical protein